MFTRSKVGYTTKTPGRLITTVTLWQKNHEKNVGPTSKTVAENHIFGGICPFVPVYYMAYSHTESVLGKDCMHSFLPHYTVCNVSNPARWSVCWGTILLND